MTAHPLTTSNRLWIVRIKRGLGRKKLARLLGHRTTSQLCRWELGNQLPSLPHALLLGYLLQTPVEFLFKELREDLIRQVQSGETSEEGQAPTERLRHSHAL